ncbi:MAG: transposase [Anaerolineae bacterium]
MAHYYKGKYRVESARLAGWDYRTPAWYFVTFCTRDHQCWLANIIDGESYVSPRGLIVAEEWLRTPYVRPNVQLDAWCIMPNHVHGILGITGGPEDPATPQGQAGTLGTIIGQIKSTCTKRIRDFGHADFGWQARFYDRVIRDEAELTRIQQYIVKNPGKWFEDRYYRPAP